MTHQLPDEHGRFGPFGGRFVPETLMNALIELEKAYSRFSEDDEFNKELNYLLSEYSGRETPLYHAEQLSRHLGGPKIYLKREDLNHTGHKINNAIGQGLLAKRMGKKKSLLKNRRRAQGCNGSRCGVARAGMQKYSWVRKTLQRQQLNVFRMKLLGAEVIPVTSGTRTLKTLVTKRFVIGSVM